MRTDARLLAVVLTLAAHVGAQAATVADNFADSDGLGGGPPADMEPFIQGFIATFGGRAETLVRSIPLGFIRSWPFRCEGPR